MEISSFLDPRFKTFPFLEEGEDKQAALETFKAHAWKLLKDFDSGEVAEALSKLSKALKSESQVWSSVCQKLTCKTDQTIGFGSEL